MDDLEFRKFVHDILNCLAIAHGKVRVVTRKVERDEANKEYLINELKKVSVFSLVQRYLIKKCYEKFQMSSM